MQSIADTEWRLLRIPSLESGIYALGHLQYAEKFNDQPEALRSTLLDAYILQTSRRDLTNLSIQESHLRRQREKNLAELKQLQEERIAKREARLNAAAHMYERFKENEDPFDPQEFGFEFSFEEIEERCGLLKATAFTVSTPNSSRSYTPLIFARSVSPPEQGARPLWPRGALWARTHPGAWHPFANAGHPVRADC